ncbi:MMPL family transporter [Corynebacterium silvaticum]|uniref:MMPL family transporter n=1 Tax=Corynebacterium silvaticum TaxID=2320431 RepID=A0A7Y4LHU4_9CORY|nr:MMPL family transporter [Corynebacterium silvaticum]ARU46896.1 MMPL family transporter [Corynebacterium silvaticum]MBH5300710.1 MMPL family transporter [Corynebacterium silvaticum]NOM64909.1 MMPL family transporter [Corynebacterium silvaticum]NON70210.1 MMPL family transporter [Corynebacterium silvaticum]TFA91672.1 MMPL family transporter [Corynebacterium silvaticum]
MFSRWGDFAYRHRRVVPVAIVVFIVAIYGIFGIRLADRMSQEGWDDPGSSSTQAANIEQEVFGRDNSGDVVLLFSSEDGIAKNKNFDEIKRYLSDLKALHPNQIADVTSYFDNRNAQLLSKDGKTAFAAVSLRGDHEQTLKDFRAIKGNLKPKFDGVTVQVAGATAVADALDSGMAGDIKRAEVVALPLVAILLLFVFGSVVAAFMPLIVGILSILGSLGVLSILAGFAQVNVFAQSVVTLLGLGLAIDYGLFMVSRFREEMDQGRDIRDAVRITTSTAGKTVVFSAAMVAVALSGLLVFPQAFLKSVAYGAISAVGLAALLSITVLPSIFAMLGTRIDKWTLRRTKRSARTLADTWWYKLPAWAMKRSKTVVVSVVFLLIALTVPLAGITFGGINETYLPPNSDVRKAQSTFDQEFPAFRTEPIKLVVSNATNDQLIKVYQQANTVTGLTDRFKPSTATKDGTTVLSAGIAERKDNESVVKQLRAIEVPEGVSVHIGGTPAMEVESIEALFEKLPWMAIYIVLATFILMSLVFGSMILPAKAIIMTILGMGATLGILTAMFVDGIGSSLFNFSAGPLMSPVLVLIMAIVYGLSTDYEVFLVSRMVEARDNGESTDEAIKYGTAHTGGIITAAALIMIVVCGAFGFSEIVMMKYIAFGMVVALLFDATIIRMLLVPAVMHLLREDNWWAPRWVKRASEAMGHNSAPEPLPVASRPVESGDKPARRVEPAQPRVPVSAYMDDTSTMAPVKEPPAPQRPAAPRPTPPRPMPPRTPPRTDAPAFNPKRTWGSTPATSHNAGGADTVEGQGSHTPKRKLHHSRRETLVSDTTVVDPRTAGRSGRIASEDNELVPFSELVKRLREEH